MKILVCGGGTGGHVLPVLAVITALDKLAGKAQVGFITQKGDESAVDAIKAHAPSAMVFELRAGKFRRYNGRSTFDKVLDIQTNLLNIRDALLFPWSVMKAIGILRRFRPDVVFVKGGFVGLPVGLAAKLRGVPIVTHDSDAVPGLTNRTLSRWAAYCAVSMPAKYFPQYPSTKLVVTGQPVRRAFKDVMTTSRRHIQNELHIPDRGQVILVAPGSLGSATVNQALLDTVAQLRDRQLTIVHITGKAGYQEILDQYAKQNVGKVHVVVKPYVENLPEYARIADIVVTRAGSMMFELAAQSKAVISIPNPFLTGAHQLRNADVFNEARAAVILNESRVKSHPEDLGNAINDLLDDAPRRKKLGQALHSFYQPHAAQAIAQLIIDAAK